MYAGDGIFSCHKMNFLNSLRFKVLRYRNVIAKFGFTIAKGGVVNFMLYIQKQ